MWTCCCAGENGLEVVEEPDDVGDIDTAIPAVVDIRYLSCRDQQCAKSMPLIRVGQSPLEYGRFPR